MDATLIEAEKDYIARWSKNALQHFDDGDYHWICEMLNGLPFCRILEIGCGAGYSTLAFLQEGFDVISIDINREAIEHTKKLLEDYELSVKVATKGGEQTDDADALLWNADLVTEEQEIIRFIHNLLEKGTPIDLIVLCNPGGQITTEITHYEGGYLRWGGFTEGEIGQCYHNRDIGLLHKWAMIYAAFHLAIQTDTPILLIERDVQGQIKGTLEQVSKDTGCRKIREFFRQIKEAPQEGIPLRNIDDPDDKLFWGAALYYPRK